MDGFQITFDNKIINIEVLHFCISSCGVEFSIHCRAISDVILSIRSAK